MSDCVFCKIAANEMPAEKVYEDKDIMIIRDVFPKAKAHYLMIPKEHYLNMSEITPERADVLAKGFLKLKELAPSLGLGGGWRLVNNCGHDAFQTVMHMHIHILGGEKLGDRFGAGGFS